MSYLKTAYTRIIIILLTVIAALIAVWTFTDLRCTVSRLNVEPAPANDEVQASGVPVKHSKTRSGTRQGSVHLGILTMAVAMSETPQTGPMESTALLSLSNKAAYCAAVNKATPGTCTFLPMFWSDARSEVRLLHKIAVG
jgi:hypothetical protein